MIEERGENEIYPNDNREPYKEEMKFLLRIDIKEKILIIFPTRRIHVFYVVQNEKVVKRFHSK
jgi:hypothetical protein